MKMFDTRTDEIQKTPKCKLSKSKVIEKISKNKFVIDFDLEKNYFLDQINTTEYFHTEERESFDQDLEQMLFGNSAFTNGSNWQYNSPSQASKKSRFTSGKLNKFTSVDKESKASEENSFCKLLNESDYYSTEKYQTLSTNNSSDDIAEGMDYYGNQVQVLEQFFYCFQQRSADVLNLFVQDAVFEVLGEEKVYPLFTTLNALAKVFLNFQCEQEALQFDYKFAYGDDNNEIIISTSGKMMANGSQPNFILSAKILLNENLIKHIKLRLC